MGRTALNGGGFAVKGCEKSARLLSSLQHPSLTPATSAQLLGTKAHLQLSHRPQQISVWSPNLLQKGLYNPFLCCPSAKYRFLQYLPSSVVTGL